MSTENLKSNQFHDAVRSSEISEYIENSLDNFSNKKIIMKVTGDCIIKIILMKMVIK